MLGIGEKERRIDEAGSGWYRIRKKEMEELVQKARVIQEVRGFNELAIESGELAWLEDTQA